MVTTGFAGRIAAIVIHRTRGDDGATRARGRLPDAARHADRAVSAAGGLDMIARQLQPLIEKRLGKPLIVENRPGGGTTIGAARSRRRRPTATRCCSATRSPLSIAVNINKNVPYDPVKDFIPVVADRQRGLRVRVRASAAGENARRVHQGGEGKAGHDFIRLRRPGIDRSICLRKCCRAMAGIKMVHVPYRGDAPVMNDMIAGHIPCAFVELGVAMPFIQAGKVTALGVSSATRVPRDAGHSDDRGSGRADVRGGVVADVRRCRRARRAASSTSCTTTSAR